MIYIYMFALFILIVCSYVLLRLLSAAFKAKNAIQSETYAPSIMHIANNGIRTTQGVVVKNGKVIADSRPSDTFLSSLI